MKINVLFSPNAADELYFSGKTTVVIDVLRASTVIATALQNGAREIIPVNTLDFAMKISGNSSSGQTLLCGERNTKMVEGFNLGNSPKEYTEEAVAKKTIILYTTNGSKSIVRAKFSENLFTCSFNNLTAVAKQLVKLNNDVEILCAGSNGRYCIEDTVCAGKLIKAATELKEDVELTDAAKSSEVIAKSFGRSVNKVLRECEHGQLLVENGFKDDIDWAAELDITNVVPFYSAGVIKAYADEQEQKPENDTKS